MKKHKVLTLIFPFFFLAKITFGYIDPGSGSLIVQLIIAFFVSALFLLKIFWGKVVSVFNKVLFRKVSNNADEQS